MYVHRSLYDLYNFFSFIISLSTQPASTLQLHHFIVYSTWKHSVTFILLVPTNLHPCISSLLLVLALKQSLIIRLTEQLDTSCSIKWVQSKHNVQWYLLRCSNVSCNSHFSLNGLASTTHVILCHKNEVFSQQEAVLIIYYVSNNHLFT